MESATTFVAPEGVYTVIEEHKPSVLQTHAANTSPLSFPARVSVITVKYPAGKDKGGGAQSFAHLLGGNNSKKEKEKAVKEKEDATSLSSSDQDEQIDDFAASSSPTAHAPTTIFSQHASKKKPSTPTKWSKPKNNMKTTSSTFITRTQNAEGYPRNLKDREGDVTFFFYNQVKTVLWVEAGSKAKEPLTRISFSSYPTCHSINQLTASPERLDIIIGFNTGDLIWLDPISSRYNRLNKGGCISSSACTSVRWVSGSVSLFLVSYADGTIVIYDRDREDGVFTPQEPVGSVSSEHWDPSDSIFVTIPPWHPVTHAGDSDLDKPASDAKSDKSIKNPVSHWRVAPKGKAVVDFVFSPDVKYVGAISEDGCLRVIDALAEQLVDCYSSYFGALTCIAWSPDGRYIITGGQDDLITIFSPWEQRVVARCQGHSSFVTCVAFDETRCHDGLILFPDHDISSFLEKWDFSSGALHRPKNLHAQHSHSHSHAYRQSISATYSTASFAYRSRSGQADGMSSEALYPPPPSSSTPVPGDGGLDEPSFDSGSPRYHPAPSRNEIAVVQPLLVKHLQASSLSSPSPPEPLPTAISFLPKHMLTSTKNGIVKLWVRPLALKAAASRAGASLDGLRSRLQLLAPKAATRDNFEGTRSNLDRSSKPIRYYLFTSFVPYRDDEQLNPQGVYKHLWYPTEKDEEHFRALRKLIQSHRSTFNAEKLEFGCIKQGMYVSKKDWKGILLSNATPAE
ncbi:hypothetical protein D9757_006586 [Collybiopsis confluens]|uniref:Catabolite repression protein creC n=1 Tax=Collybiopsis confluens TaxID=2823264 RepID=A0A8H5HQH0_9AGAR|nr:hypothetical protein D9757_006586 [Collybiopsis confluens]